MDEHDAAWQRAELLLVAHAKMSESELHPFDVPSVTIERLLTDLMHYCHERNSGVPLGSGEYLEFEHMIVHAKEQFVREREAIPEIHETRLDPDRPAPDPEFEKFQNKLYSRQLEERGALEGKHKAQIDRLGPSKQLSDQHLQECTNQTREFEKERERYTREFHEARRIACEREQQEKQNVLDPLQDKKITRSS